MRIGHEKGFGAIDLHDTNILSNVIDIAVFSLNFSDAVSVRIQGHTDGCTKTVTPARVDGSVCSGRTSSLGAVGHERQDQTLESINAILHVVWGASGYMVDAGLLARAGRGIDT